MGTLYKSAPVLRIVNPREQRVLYLPTSDHYVSRQIERNRIVNPEEQRVLYLPTSHNQFQRTNH